MDPPPSPFALGFHVVQAAAEADGVTATVMPNIIRPVVRTDANSRSGRRCETLRNTQIPSHSRTVELSFVGPKLWRGGTCGRYQTATAD